MSDPQTENSARELYAALSVLLRDPKTRAYLLAHDRQAVLQGEQALYNRTLAFHMCDNLADRERWDAERNLAGQGLNEVNELIEGLRTRTHPHHPEGFCTPASCTYSQALLASMRSEARTFHLEHNVTGARLSRDFESYDVAQATCGTLNSAPNSGGYAGIYDSNGKRVHYDPSGPTPEWAAIFEEN